MSAVVIPIAPPRIAVSTMARIRASSSGVGFRALKPSTAFRAWVSLK